MKNFNNQKVSKIQSQSQVEPLDPSRKSNVSNSTVSRLLISTHSKTFFRNQKVFGDFKRIVSHIDPDGDQVAVTKKYSSKKIPQPEDIQVEVPNVDFDEHSGTFSNIFVLLFLNCK